MIFLLVLIALAVSAGTARVLAWCGPVDRPRRRGLHSAPTPTAGGLALMLGVGVAALLATPFASGGQAIGGALAIAVAHGLLGAVDDVFDMGAGLKLAVQVALALAFAALIARPDVMVVNERLAIGLPVWAALVGTVLWLVVATNAVNFMDGANGLVAGSLAIAATGLGLTVLNGGSGLVAMGFLALAGACLGFLPTNFPKAKLFQGDAGALFAGSLIAMLAVIGAVDGAFPLWSGPIALMPILADVLLTLIVRASRRERLLQAHRDHLYQRWLAARGGSHPRLAARFWAITGAFTFAAMLAARANATVASLMLIGSIVVAVLGWLWIDRSVRTTIA